MTWAIQKRFSVHKQYTAAETGVALYTPDARNRIAIHHISVVPTGATGGACTVWFGASGDTTYTLGTDQPVVAGTLTPSAADTAFTGAEQLRLELPEPGGIVSQNAGYVLRFTSGAAIDVDIVIHGAEVR